MRGSLQKKGTMSQIDIPNSSLIPTDEEMESAKKVGPKINIDLEGVTYG